MTETVAARSEKLESAILADARQVAERLQREARERAAAVLAEAEAEAGRIREAALAGARTEAARERERILATLPLEENRHRATRIDEALESLRGEAERRLDQALPGPQGEHWLDLAAEAVQRMGGERFTVRIGAPVTDAMAADLAREISARCGRSPGAVRVVGDAGGGAGVVVEDAGGGQVWDNRYRSRLARSWPEWRRQIALGLGWIQAPPREGEGS